MSESNQPKAGGLWARLFGMQSEADEPMGTTSDPEPVPVAEPGPPSNGTPAVVEEAVVAEEIVVAEVEAPVAAEPVVEAVPAEAPVAEEPVAPQICAACGAERQIGAAYCHDCGWLFPVGAAASSPRDSTMPSATTARLQNRYEIGALVCDRQGVLRHRGVDHTTGQAVVIVSAPLPEVVAADAAPVAAVVAEDDIMPGFDDEVLVATPVGPEAGGTWPSVGWEKALLAKASHPALPRLLDEFTVNGTEYLILESPVGASLWDAWDDPEANAQVRYAWLQQIAAGLQALHRAGAIFEGIRPDVVVIGDVSQPRITDLADVLPIPMPANAPIKATLYTAPELILAPGSADGRSDLYSFGALLYSLEYLHHPLEEKDFERQFTPLQITERFPDVHPLFLRLINKTFCRDVNTRFPTDEMNKTDPTGFTELIKTLGVAGRAFDDVRLDIAAWTTTGMVRTGNEDAFSVLHGVDSPAWTISTNTR